MRHLVSKLMTASMVAGAALLVSACGGEKPAEDTNTTTEINSAEPMMDGTTNDTMTDGDAMSMNTEESNMMEGNAM